MKKRSAGFTLIELVVAVGIASILARLSFGYYGQYIMRANRSAARSALVSLAAKQEVLNLQNGGYATDFSSLNGLPSPTCTFYIDQNGAPSTAASGSSIYQISISSTTCTTGTSTSFTLEAVAQGVQAKRDTACTTLILTSTGLKQAQTSSGTSVPTSGIANCWYQ